MTKKREVVIPIVATRRTWSWRDKHGKEYLGRKANWVISVNKVQVGNYSHLVGDGTAVSAPNLENLQRIADDFTLKYGVNPIRVGISGFSRYDNIENMVFLGEGDSKLEPESIKVTLAHELGHHVDAQKRRVEISKLHDMEKDFSISDDMLLPHLRAEDKKREINAWKYADDFLGELKTPEAKMVRQHSIVGHEKKGNLSVEVLSGVRCDAFIKRMQENRRKSV